MRKNLRKAAPPGVIHPEAVYTLTEFQRRTGISATRMRMARQEDVDVKHYMAGRRSTSWALTASSTSSGSLGFLPAEPPG